MMQKRLVQYNEYNLVQYNTTKRIQIGCFYIILIFSYPILHLNRITEHHILYHLYRILPAWDLYHFVLLQFKVYTAFIPYSRLKINSVNGHLVFIQKEKAQKMYERFTHISLISLTI